MFKFIPHNGESLLQLSKEDITHGNTFISEIPVFGNYANLIGYKLNKLYSKHKDQDDPTEVTPLGADMDDPDYQVVDYQLTKHNIVSGMDNVSVTINDSHLSIESLHTGLGRYDITRDILAQSMGYSNVVIWTLDYAGKYTFSEEITERIRDLVLKENKTVILVVFIPEGIPFSEITFEETGIWDIMTLNRRLSLYLTTKIEVDTPEE